MTKVYVMESCPDCTAVKDLYRDDAAYTLVDIGQQARNLKEFLVLRDNHPAFAKVRERGNIGIPCFVREDGAVAVSLRHFQEGRFVEAPLPEPQGEACRLDGTGC